MAAVWAGDDQARVVDPDEVIFDDDDDDDTDDDDDNNNDDEGDDGSDDQGGADLDDADFNAIVRCSQWRN